MRRTGLERVALALCAFLVLSAQGVWAIDMQALIDRAIDADLELAKLGLSRRVAELRVAQTAAARGWKVALAPISYGLRLGIDPLASAPQLTVDADYALTATSPWPSATSFYVGTDSELYLPSGNLTPRVTAGVTQPVNSLLSARVDRRVRELGETLALLQADVAIAARRLAAAQLVISGVKALGDLYLGARDLEEQLADLAEEAARAKALDAEGERGIAFRQVEQKRLGAQESLKRLEREYEVRKARLETELGVTLDDELPGVEEPLLDLPRASESVVNAAVKSAEIEVELAEARLEQQKQSRIPGMSAGLAVWLQESSTSASGLALPLTVTLKLNWQPLDSGLRALTREELERQLDIRKLSLEQARRAFDSSLVDLELERMGIANRTADAVRALEAAAESVRDTRVLVEKGLKTERDLAKAVYAAAKRKVQLDLLAFDRLAFGFKVQALVLLK